MCFASITGSNYRRGDALGGLAHPGGENQRLCAWCISCWRRGPPAWGPAAARGWRRSASRSGRRCRRPPAAAPVDAEPEEEEDRWEIWRRNTLSVRSCTQTTPEHLWFTEQRGIRLDHACMGCTELNNLTACINKWFANVNFALWCSPKKVNSVELKRLKSDCWGQSQQKCIFVITFVSWGGRHWAPLGVDTFF